MQPIVNQLAIGNCYVAAYALRKNSDIRQQKDRILLCHGIGTQTQPPFVRMGHAWVEELHLGVWWCRDGLFPNNLVPRDRYYEVGNVSDVIRYTWNEAKAQHEKHGYIGAWDEKISAAAHAGD